MEEKKFIFLDRDGTIIQDEVYSHNPTELKFLPGAVEGLWKLAQDGYEFIVVSNQAGVAKGKYTSHQAHAYNNEMLSQLADQGIRVLKAYMCFHHPDVSWCNCRKPNPGMVHQAVGDIGMEPCEAIFAGDKDCDIQLGQFFKARTFLVENGQYEATSTPDHRVKNLLEMYEILKKGETAGT